MRAPKRYDKPEEVALRRQRPVESTTRCSARIARNLLKEVRLVHKAPRAPVRTCVGCRTSRPKVALIRLARTPAGIRCDAQHRLPGRGAYLCPDLRCVASAGRRDAGALRRALRGGTVAEAGAALENARTAAEQYQVPTGTVRSENA